MEKKILIALPCLICGGTEVQTLTLVRVLTSIGYRVVVCCYYEYDNDMVYLFRRTGAEVILMKLIRSKDLIYLIFKLMALFQKIRPEIIHVQYMSPGLAPILAAKLSGIRKTFATVHQSGRPYGVKAKLLLRSGAFFCTVFFCVSQATETSWFGNSEIFNTKKNLKYTRKHYTIYNGVDVKNISKMLKTIDSSVLKENIGLGTGSVIGFVGRLKEEKGLDILIK